MSDRFPRRWYEFVPGLHHMYRARRNRHRALTGSTGYPTPGGTR